MEQIDLMKHLFKDVTFIVSNDTYEVFPISFTLDEKGIMIWEGLNSEYELKISFETLCSTLEQGVDKELYYCPILWDRFKLKQFFLCKTIKHA